MPYTIKSITNCTIILNSLGRILRGNSADPEKYPESATIVKEINDDQWRELNGLVKDNLISIDGIDEKPKIVSEIDSLKKGKGVGNKIKRVGGESALAGEDSESIIVTAAGIQRRKGRKTMDDKEDESFFKESILAAKKLDNERETEEYIVNEEDLDISERMGNEAVISGGRNVTQKVKAKKLSEVNKISWVDLEDTPLNDKGSITRKSPEKAETYDPLEDDNPLKDIFVDNPFEDGDDDALDDRFVE
jgi:hypothetical protein